MLEPSTTMTREMPSSEELAEASSVRRGRGASPRRKHSRARGRKGYISLQPMDRGRQAPEERGRPRKMKP